MVTESHGLGVSHEPQRVMMGWSPSYLAITFVTSIAVEIVSIMSLVRETIKHHG